MWKLYNDEFKEKQKGKLLNINVCLFKIILVNYYKLLFSVVYMSIKKKKKNYLCYLIGEVSLAIDGVWFYPKDPNNPEHQKAAENARMSTVNIQKIFF